MVSSGRPAAADIEHRAIPQVAVADSAPAPVARRFSTRTGAGDDRKLRASVWQVSVVEEPGELADVGAIQSALWRRKTWRSPLSPDRPARMAAARWCRGPVPSSAARGHAAVPVKTAEPLHQIAHLRPPPPNGLLSRARSARISSSLSPSTSVSISSRRASSVWGRSAATSSASPAIVGRSKTRYRELHAERVAQAGNELDGEQEWPRDRRSCRAGRSRRCRATPATSA